MDSAIERLCDSGTAIASSNLSFITAFSHSFNFFVASASFGHIFLTYFSIRKSIKHIAHWHKVHAKKHHKWSTDSCFEGGEKLREAVGLVFSLLYSLSARKMKELWILTYQCSPMLQCHCSTNMNKLFLCHFPSFNSDLFHWNVLTLNILLITFIFKGACNLF